MEMVNKLNLGCVEQRLAEFFRRSSRYILVDFHGRFRLLQTVKRTSFERGQVEDRVAERLSAGDLALTSAEFTCSKGARGEVHPAAPRQEWGPCTRYRS